jgi:hypothetical protein
MQRRKYLAALGSLAAGGAAMTGTGAFNTVNANRAVSVEVASDASAFLGLTSLGPYSQLDGDDKLVLTLDSDATVSGSGINEDGVTQILEVFQVENQGSQQVGISIDSESLNNALNAGSGPDSTEQLHFFVGEPGGITLDTYDPNSLVGGVGGPGWGSPPTDPRIIGTGETLPVGLYVVNAGSDWDVEEDVTINAYSETALLNNNFDS